MSGVLTAPWMVYGLIVGLLVAAAAALGEHILRAAGRPARWIWAGALGLTLVLVAAAPQRVERTLKLRISAPSPTATTAAVVTQPLAWGDRAIAAGTAAARAIAAPVRWTLAAAGRVVPAAFDAWLPALWASLSVVLFGVFALVYARFNRARVRWPVADVQGTRVRIAPTAGPAVVGLSNPEIIVPGWLLERSNEEQRLVLVHEREHVAARDPLLLAAACAAAVIMPWHPAVWWMLSRLRLAVELDCDGRVLRRGVAARSYGTLLIDLAGRCSGLRIGAPALADESSHLHQRLMAMTSRPSRFTPARSVAAAVFASVALLAACEAKLPTATEVNDMSASTAVAGAQKMSLMSDGADAQYKVDGVAVSAAEANAITPDRIASIEVTKGPSAPNGKSLVEITTRKPGESGPQRERIRITGTPSESGLLRTDGPRKHLDNFTGVILVDGVRVTEAAMQAIAPNDIVSVEVIKGEPAALLYAAPEAKNGVIRITTKKGIAK